MSYVKLECSDLEKKNSVPRTRQGQHTNPRQANIKKGNNTLLFQNLIISEIASDMHCNQIPYAKLKLVWCVLLQANSF